MLTRLKTIGRGGGLLIGPTHNVQLDTPMENFWAMIETIRQTPYQGDFVMTKREIIRAVLEGQKPPYVPWSCGFTKEARAKLQAHFAPVELEDALQNHL